MDHQQRSAEALVSVGNKIDVLQSFYLPRFYVV
jgi:hypothetical protein